ncbi:uncharacterized protein LOC102717884 [Oryza brachyantha]|uniref:uncharacterized protein LOC102717884 n=1 Tax=Oryza brachyantha TaxID=4533 RepID=UPI001ADA7734|nr:uncharacterized protein LOC102717884 [Oryza brachyantha]
MGSLMAGWNSPVLGDEKKVRLMRNRSLTREEVAAFWRRQQQQQQRKPPPEDHDGNGSSSPLSSPRAAAAGNVSPLSSPRAGDMSPLASPGGGRAQQETSRCPLRRLERLSSMPSPLARTVMTRADDCPYQSYSHSEPPSPAAPHHDRQRPFADQHDDDDDDGASTSSECWWTRSSWAFLNETPSLEQQTFGKSQTYACVQFHVSRVVTGNA